MNKTGFDVPKVKDSSGGITSQMKQGMEATSIAQVGAKLSKLAKELMDASTTPIIDIYSKGMNFTIGDNAKLYEIVKVVKDIVDNQFYNRGARSFSFGFTIDVKSHCVCFNITMDDEQAFSDMDNKITAPAEIQTPMDFAQKLADLITFNIQRKYMDSVDVERKVEPIMSSDSFMGQINKTQLQIIVREKVEDN